jgi:hypothetical protein
MAKTRKNRNNLLKKISKTTQKSIPLVNKGLNKVGHLAKDVANKSVPIVNKGVTTVFDTLSKGFNLGLKGVKNVTNTVKNIAKSSKKHHSKKSRGKKSQKH